MCFDAFYLSVHEACGHAKQPPVRLGWLNCLNFPCSLRLHAEDPATYNFDLRAWRRAKQLPPLGTPAQTIRFPEPGLCRICREWAGMHAKVGLDEVPALPMHIVKGMWYPIDMEYAPPRGGRPWLYQKLKEGYWVYILDGWVGDAGPSPLPKLKHLVPTMDAWAAREPMFNAWGMEKWRTRVAAMASRTLSQTTKTTSRPVSLISSSGSERSRRRRR